MGAGTAGSFFGIASFLRPAGLGAGDAKLALLLGVHMGMASIPGLMLGLVLALAWCFARGCLGGRAALKGMAVPLAPFLACGTSVALALAE